MMVLGSLAQVSVWPCVDVVAETLNGIFAPWREWLGFSFLSTEENGVTLGIDEQPNDLLELAAKCWGA